MELRLLTARDLRRALPMAEAIETMKQAFAALSSGRAVMPQRLAIPVQEASGTLLVKPAYLPGTGLGAKLVSFFPGNRERGRPAISGLVVALDPASGEPRAICDGGFLTAWRTGAASGAATDLLARGDARIGAVIGCGAQGRTQALAIDAVRELEEIRLFSRTRERVERLAEELAPELRARPVAVESAAAALAGADVVCTATDSATPVFAAADLADGAHLNGIGSFTPRMQEVDAATVGRARVWVDSLESAQAEAGDLLVAEKQGQTRRDDWVELGHLILGRAPGRGGEDEVTFFKSVGVAAQDVAALSAALGRADELGLGSSVDLEEA